MVLVVPIVVSSLEIVWNRSEVEGVFHTVPIWTGGLYHSHLGSWLSYQSLAVHRFSLSIWKSLTAVNERQMHLGHVRYQAIKPTRHQNLKFQISSAKIHVLSEEFFEFPWRVVSVWVKPEDCRELQVMNLVECRCFRSFQHIFAGFFSLKFLYLSWRFEV